MTSYIFYILAFLTLISCENGVLKNNSSNIDGLKISDSVAVVVKPSEDFETTEIDCDTVYKGKGYKLLLKTFDTTNEDETKFNAIFALYKIMSKKRSEIFKDSIFSTVQKVKFEDFNDDKVKDILIQNFSDVRSNWTYYLYLIDTANDKLKKIKGFEEIKNPNYIPEYDLIDNYVMSGRNWTSFYKIEGDSVKDYGIEIFDGENDNGKVTYDKDYKKGITTLLAKQKSKH